RREPGFLPPPPPTLRGSRLLKDALDSGQCRPAFALEIGGNGERPGPHAAGDGNQIRRGGELEPMLDAGRSRQPDADPKPMRVEPYETAAVRSPQRGQPPGQ